MTLYEAHGKEVKVTLKNGKVFSGFVEFYTSALDNEPDPASICVGSYELFENEIESIELL